MPSSRLLRSLPAWLMAAAVLTACPSPEKVPAGGSCSATSECSEGECTGGVCTVCNAGEDGCGCLGNNMCNSGLRCNAARCEPCPEGAEGCACRGNGTCDGTLLCQDSVCAEPSCVPGTQGCPCGTGDSCGPGLICAANNTCATCSDDVAGCPCSNGTCRGGLVCDSASSNCRDPIPCSEAGCAAEQQCMAAGSGTDARCLPSCNPGFTWNAQTLSCDAIPTANCDAGAAGSILADCDAQNRGCSADANGASCTTCKDGFTDESGNLMACRAVRACSELSSLCDADNRDCTPAGTNSDAVCGACKTGYTEMGGTCVQDLPATCDADGGMNSIAATCQARGRTCDTPDGGGNATCGACLPGYQADLADAERCVQPRTCQDIMPSCASVGRECAGDPRAECTDCLPGLVPSDPNDPASACRVPLTCNDLETQGMGCTGDTFCLESAGADARCVDWPCTNMLGMADTTKARRQDSGVCVTCTTNCSEAGTTGRYWPYTRQGSDSCICETEPGYYYDVSEAFSAVDCDADDDGWVRDSAQFYLNHADPALKANARCDLHTIDRFILKNEWQETRTILSCAEGLKDSTSGACNTPSPLPLYESVRNDDAMQFSSANDTLLPVYGEAARRLLPSEVNPLTKACVSRLADYNDNRKADLEEFQGQMIDSTLRPEVQVFSKMAYFVELHRGRIVPSTTGHGAYEISERSRCEPGFPIRYDARSGDYWKQCTRNRDSQFDAQNNQLGQDFGQFNCTDATGTCPTPPDPTTVQPMQGSVPPHGLCELTSAMALPPSGDAAGWRGMQHASQFRCVDVVNMNPDTNSRLVSAFVDNPTTETTQREQFNRCRVGCPMADPNCTADCAGGTCTTSSEPVTPGQPRHPVITCEAVPRMGTNMIPQPQNGDVGFAAYRYFGIADPDPSALFTRGCINEWKEWPQLCPGYNPDEQVGVGEGNTQAFGQLVCGCARNYGGPDCNVGCPDAELFTEMGYTAATRTGYWMCASMSLSDNPTLSDGNTNGYTLTGGVPMSATGSRLCQNADCATGYVLH